MIAKPVCGVVVGILIGVGCRFFEIPLPGPPAILGAFLAVAIRPECAPPAVSITWSTGCGRSLATGYTVTDRILTARARAEAPRISAEATRAER